MLGPSRHPVHPPAPEGDSDQPARPIDPYEPLKLVTGSVTAQVLYQIAIGTRAIVVNSPPGGGKSTLITHLAQYLHARMNVSVVIGVPRRAQAADLADRLRQIIDPAYVALAVTGMQSPAGYGRKVAGGTGVQVRTLDSLKLSDAGGRLLIVDEAYQVTTETGAAAANGFSQVVAVGDPGQIGPVIPVNTWAWGEVAPHRPFASTLLSRADVWTTSLPSTYRLGSATTAAIAPLYDFTFDSCRPPVHIEGLRELDHIVVPSPASPVDPALMQAAVTAATAIIGRTVTDTRSPAPRAVQPHDVAVCAATRAQVSVLRARLSAAGLNRTRVGTADEIQGGQWLAVVGVDPLAGGHVSDHHADTGRLCVMLSRHIAHLTWVHDGGWVEGALPGIDPRAAALHRTVRAAVCATSDVAP